MDMEDASLVLTALSQPSRLEAFRLLVRHEPDGMAAGAIAREMAVPQNTMSAHLSVLARAGLVSNERQSRSIIYRADIGRLRELMLFLVNDCCGGRADLCGSLVNELAGCLPAGRDKRS
ncbi:ArsR/SmtB family transcription factor [Notoacmeibacter ruber]|uniref:Transcriptional regulator n=1 Tax=Notoacmeibacter ruber TaxID=2670375 RepID=A0A3L7JE07_9HYPH|nr:metalloregulator ArsR/SmtB family transcription factor [Notoacmeibacter ruber]RLQ88545.1 transcriptional regulator [Notoacmeibacter ruber]